MDHKKLYYEIVGAQLKKGTGVFWPSEQLTQDSPVPILRNSQKKRELPAEAKLQGTLMKELRKIPILSWNEALFTRSQVSSTVYNTSTQFNVGGEGGLIKGIDKMYNVASQCMRHPVAVPDNIEDFPDLDRKELMNKHFTTENGDLTVIKDSYGNSHTEKKGKDDSDKYFDKSIQAGGFFEE